MASSKKYGLIVEQNNSKWVAKITRKVSSKKTVTTKEQDGFKSQADAQSWAETTLAELTETLKKSNERHGAQRKNIEEVRRQRSARRAEKTEQAKAEKAAQEALEDTDSVDE